MLLMTAASIAAASTCFAAEVYVKASVDTTGRMVIVTKDGRSRILPKQKDQEDFEDIAVSGDGRAVGWLALYPNLSTSYPIPLALVVYSGGRLREFRGLDLPVSRWRFAAGGRQVAFRQETLHGGFGTHYELRDIASGRLVSQWDPDYDPHGQALPNQQPPPWAAPLAPKDP